MAPLDLAIASLRQDPPDVDRAIEALLSVKEAHETVTATPEFVSVAEAARRLRVCQSHLRILIKSGRVLKPPHYPPKARKPKYAGHELERVAAEVAAQPRQKGRRPVPEGFVSKGQLAQRVKARPAVINCHIRAGHIPAPTHSHPAWRNYGKLWTAIEAESVVEALRQWWKTCPILSNRRVV